jgi:hypothetical protein
MHEIVLNLHMHTRYSDGFGTHQDIAEAALQAGVDAVIVTDHNVLVKGPEGYYRNGDRRVLMLVGEEIHDRTRVPQKNHLLVFGGDRELAPLSPHPQRLLDGVQDIRGLAFLAHPVEYAAPVIREPDLSWVDWDVRGFTGIELWNAMTEFKSLVRTREHGLFYALNPQLVARGPFPASLKKWDDLLSEGKRVVAIGGSDAHAFPLVLGPLKRAVFPYAFHFKAINTHILLPQPLSWDAENDRGMVLEALRQGRAFIGYDLIAPTRGFRFTAQGWAGRAWMGEEVSAHNGVTLQIRLPDKGECRLIKDGQLLKDWSAREHCTHITSEPGVYRAEVYRSYRGRRRGWIFSNPIYVR